MDAVERLWRLPADVELWLILAYVAGVLVAARAIEAVAKAHYARARRYAERGFEYVEPRDHYRCLGGATLTLETIHENERMAIYRAPVEYCGGCRLKPICAPHEASRRVFRSLAIWAETDVGRFHHYFSQVMFAGAGAVSLAAMCHWHAQPGTGYLVLALAGSVACLVLQSRRMKIARPVAQSPVPNS
jgi:hypothetical protein